MADEADDNKKKESESLLSWLRHLVGNALGFTDDNKQAETNVASNQNSPAQPISTDVESKAQPAVAAHSSEHVAQQKLHNAKQKLGAGGPVDENNHLRRGGHNHPIRDLSYFSGNTIGNQTGGFVQPYPQNGTSQSYGSYQHAERQTGITRGPAPMARPHDQPLTNEQIRGGEEYISLADAMKNGDKITDSLPNGAKALYWKNEKGQTIVDDTNHKPIAIKEAILAAAPDLRQLDAKIARDGVQSASVDLATKINKDALTAFRDKTNGQYAEMSDRAIDRIAQASGTAAGNNAVLMNQDGNKAESLTHASDKNNLNIVKNVEGGAHPKDVADVLARTDKQVAGQVGVVKGAMSQDAMQTALAQYQAQQAQKEQYAKNLDASLHANSPQERQKAHDALDAMDHAQQKNASGGFAVADHSPEHDPNPGHAMTKNGGPSKITART